MKATLTLIDSILWDYLLWDTEDKNVRICVRVVLQCQRDSYKLRNITF